METLGEKRTAEIGLPTSSKPQQKRARVQLFIDSYTAKWPSMIVPSECDDYTFCKVCDDSFFIAQLPQGDQSQTHRRIEQTLKTNSSIRQFFAAVEDCRFESSECQTCRGHAL